MATSARPEGFTLRQIIDVLVARKALVFSVFLMTLITAAVVTALMPRWYYSKAMIRVQKPEEKVSLFQAERPGFFDPYFTQEQLEILRSKQVLYQVIGELGLQRELGNIFAEGRELTLDQTYQVLVRRMLAIESAKPGTALIDVGVWAKGDPKLAAVIANAIAGIYAEDRVAFAVSDQMEGLARLRDELEAQERLVAEQRDRVEALRGELGVAGVDIGVQMMTQEIENLRMMERTLVSLRVDAMGRKARWENFARIAREERLGLINSELVQDVNIQSLLQAYLVSEQQQQRLRSQLGEAHPELQASVRNSETIGRQLDEMLEGYAKALEISWLEAQARVGELENQLRSARAMQIDSARDVMRPFEEAVEKLREEEQIYQTLKLTLRQREIDFQAPKKSIEILNPAEPALYAARPNWLLNMMLATVAGLVLGGGSALLVHVLDTSFHSMAELEETLGLPILGVVPRGGGFVDKGNFESPLAEPYRVIQANLDFAGASPKILAVQSSGPGEGKSTTLHNLAAVMALAGQRVLVVDSDVRRPTMHTITGCEKAPGLQEVLAGSEELSSAIQKTSLPGLSLLSAGSGMSYLTVLQKQRLKGILEQLSAEYDRVLLDSPPVLGVSDAMVVAGCADGVLLVVEHRRNPKAMVERTSKTLRQGGVKLLGVVINRVPPGGSGDHGYYTANYNYYTKTSAKAGSAKRVEKGGNREKREPETFDIVES